MAETENEFAKLAQEAETDDDFYPKSENEEDSQTTIDQALNAITDTMNSYEAVNEAALQAEAEAKADEAAQQAQDAMASLKKAADKYVDEIDWEKRRYEIAKEVMSAMISKTVINISSIADPGTGMVSTEATEETSEFPSEELAQNALAQADMLIALIKPEEEADETEEPQA